MIKKLSRDELGTVHDLAHVIWPLVYSKMITAEQMNYMLQWMYDPAHLAVKYDNGDLFFTYQVDAMDIGYLHLEPIGSDVLKIQKVYVHPDFHGRGIGRELIIFTEHIARQQGRDALELQVNRGNPALQFYQHLGFSIVDEQDFDIGQGFFMNDFVMRKVI